jgi:polyisoprenoid-binding protein YceI
VSIDRPRPAARGATALVVVSLSLALAACGQAPAAPDLATATDALGSGTSAPGAQGPEGAGLDVLADGPDGVWVVAVDAVPSDPAAGLGTFVGFRIDEELSTLGRITAVGRTPEVEGEVSVAGGAIVDGTFRAPLSGLATDDGRRDGAVRRLLGDAEATFTVVGPVAIEDLPAPGGEVALRVPGLLTVGAVTREVEADLRVGVDGTTLVVVGTIATRLSDLGVPAPRAPIVLSVADEVVIEVQLYLVRRG